MMGMSSGNSLATSQEVSFVCIGTGKGVLKVEH